MTPTTPSTGRRRRSALAFAVAFSLLAAACSSDSGSDVASDEADDATGDTAVADTTSDTAATGGGSSEPWPLPDWQDVDAETADMDQAVLDALAADAEASGSMCLVVTRDGQLVDERYWNGADAGTEQETFSTSKSITSTLVGIAVDQGLIDLDDPASDYIQEWKGTPSESVTIRHLVSNDSGRYQDAISDYVTMAVQEPDKTQYSVDLDQQFDPGTEWVYNNAAIQTLDRVLEEATGMPTADFARTELFEPLGMDSQVATDEAGNALMFMGTQASCRDLARFGLLFLREGRWGDEQLLSSEWVAEATRPSQDLNESYGFLWWLNGGGDIANPDGAGVRSGLGADTPDDAFAALGLGSQVVLVVPSSGVVAVRLAPVNRDPDAPAFGVAEIGAAMSRAVVDATGAG